MRFCNRKNCRGDLQGSQSLKISINAFKHNTYQNVKIF